MAIIAENKGQDFKKIEPGTYAARCFSMIEIGTITEDVKGKSVTHKKVMLSWEFPTEKEVFKQEKGEEPYTVSKTYTLSMNEKATLRKDLESWRGKGFTKEEAEKFDITKLISAECMMNVIHKQSDDGQKTYLNIASISRMPKGMKCDPQINPTRILSYDNFSWEIYNSLPDFLKDKIKVSVEFKALQQPSETPTEEPVTSDSPEDDLPF